MTVSRNPARWTAIAVGMAVLSACSSTGGDSAAPPAATPSPLVSAPADQVAGGPPSPAPTLPASPPPTATPAPPPAPAPLDPTAVEAAGPRALAHLLTRAETAIRDPSVRGGRLAAAAGTQQLVYRRLVRTPRLRSPVLRRLPAGLRPLARAHVGAGASLSALATPQPRLPDWRIVQPPPPSRLLRYYRKAAARFGLDWEYLAAINLVETRMGRIRGRSTAGAQGPMQFMPATWDAYGRGDVNDPADAVMAAARYLSANGAPRDMRGALWAYNHSDLYVDAVSAYADVMRADPRAYRGYYHWQVYFRTPKRDVHLPVGYGD